MTPLKNALQDVANMPDDAAPANDAGPQIDRHTITERVTKHYELLDRLHTGEGENE